MGESAPAKRAARRVKNRIVNDKLRMTGFKILLRSSFFLCLFCALAGNLSAQNSISTQKKIDFSSIQLNLQEQIRSGKTEQKRQALLQIRSFESEEASRVAIPALRDSNEIVRATATFSVIFLPPDEAFSVLAPLLQDKSALVRREAAYALGRIRNSSAVSPLLQILQKDKIPEVRNAAVVALGEIGDVAAVNVLTSILQNRPKTENEADDFLRRAAAHSIGQIAQNLQTKNPEILAPENSSPDEYKFQANQKYVNLAEQNPAFKPAGTILIGVLQNSRETDDTRREAAFALGEIGGSAALPVLQTASGSPDYYLTEISREALKKIASANPPE